MSVTPSPNLTGLPKHGSGTANTTPAKQIAVPPHTGTGLPRRPIIALLDKFKTLELDLDGDGVPDESHGNVIQNMVRKALPQALIEPYEIGDLNAAGYIQRLQALKKKMDTGEKIDAINVSIGTMVNNRFTTLKVLSTYTGLPLTNDNVKDNREKIRQVLAQKAADSNTHKNTAHNAITQAMQESWSVIQTMEALSEAHPVKFYIAAGNEPGDFNLLTLANNAVVVGGLNRAGKKLPHLTQNSLVSRYFQAETQTRPVYQNNAFVGFNYTGRPKGILATDIPKARLSTFRSQPNRPSSPETLLSIEFTGTSIAVPLAIAEDIMKQFPGHPPSQIP